MLSFLGHFLFVLAAWTLIIKFVFPVAFAAAQGIALTAYVYWDFWWIIHIWLGWALLEQPAYTRRLALVTSVVEIGIITVKLTLFLRAPEWNIWQTNWFINKLFVLACFVMLLGVLAFGPARATAR